MSQANLNAVIHKLAHLTGEWKEHASREGSALYRAGVEHCSMSLERVIEDLNVALEEWSRDLAGLAPAPEPPFIKCLACGKKSYHPKDIEERYCAQCHMFHDLMDEGLTHEVRR